MWRSEKSGRVVRAFFFYFRRAITLTSPQNIPRARVVRMTYPPAVAAFNPDTQKCCDAHCLQAHAAWRVRYVFYTQTKQKKCRHCEDGAKSIRIGRPMTSALCIFEAFSAPSGDMNSTNANALPAFSRMSLMSPHDLNVFASVSESM